MRSTLLVAAFLGSLCCILPAQAQTSEEWRTVTAPEVLVHSGPKETYYPTSKLKKGDKVLVRRANKDPKWLEIKPPVGSFSWVQALYIKPEGRYTGTVTAAEDTPVPIRPGSAVTDKKPDVTWCTLQRGDGVVILDEPFKADDKFWLPIDVTPEEVRYIPASAVSPSGETYTGTASPQVRSLIEQADRALTISNQFLARNYYMQAMNQTQQYDEKLYCGRKLNEIDKNTGKAAGSSMQPGHPNYLAARNAQTPATFANQTNIKYTTSKQPVHSAANPSPSGSADWSEWGTLQASNFYLNGQRMYSLVDKKGQVLIYAVTPPNLTLDTYRGRTICLYGTRANRTDGYPPTQYMHVTYVAFP